MDDDMWDVDIHYGGYFINGGNSRRYVGGQINFFCVNRNLASYIRLLDYLGSICNLPPNSVPSIYFKISTMELGDEMRIVENDKQLMDMFDETREGRKIEMYVVGKDFTPLERDEGRRVEAVNLYPSFDWPSDSSVYITVESESDEDHMHDKHVIYDENRDVEDPPLAVGLEFTSSEQFRVALRQYAIKNSFDVIFQFNSKRRVTAHCKTEGCQWRIHASLKIDKSTFQVKKFISKHSEHCQAINLAGNKMATESWIAEKISERIRIEPDWTITSIKNHLFSTYQLVIPYKRVWRRKQKALKDVFGSYEEAYSMVPHLCQAILEYNPGSIARLKVTDDHAFHRLFISFRASIRGFRRCRSVIGIDGCHLKGKYKGVLLAAVALDADNGLFSLAFSLVEIEKEESWAWFLENLLMAIGNERHVTFISDRQKGLINAMSLVFPTADHRFCVRHMHKNFKKNYPGLILKDLFWKSATAYNVAEFNAVLTKMKSVSPLAYQWMMKENPTTWSRSHFDERCKRDLLNNNFTESFNNWISKARHMSVIDLVDSIRAQLMTQFYERRENAEKMLENGDIVGSRIKKKLTEIKKTAENFIIRYSGMEEYEVDTGLRRFSLHLLLRTCSCRRWQLSGLPCNHAAAVILHTRRRIEDFCEDCFYLPIYKEQYADLVHPMPDKTQWRVPESEYIVGPPHECRRPGRPKKNRRRDADEEVQQSQKGTTRCKRCNESGHNSRTCKKSINSQASSNSHGGPSSSRSHI